MIKAAAKNSSKSDESLLYYFKLSNEIREDIEVRLHAENGNFKAYLGAAFIPTEMNYTLVGDERQPLIFKQKEANTLEVVTYYILVKVLQHDTNSVSEMAHQFTIAFYESGSSIQLLEGIPMAGVIRNDTFDYYRLDINRGGGGNLLDYQIVLTPKAGGNPDLVISLNSSNKFPNRVFNDYISEEEFSADSVNITAKMLKEYEEKSGQRVKYIYIGVFTDSNLNSSFTILAT